MVAPPAKHHYIPRFYQRGFISDKSNRIWVYEKGREPRQYSIRKTGMKIALYGFKNSRGEVDIETVEKGLSKIDDYGAKVIHKIEKKTSIDDRERRRLCRFVSVMWRRTPKHMEEANKMASEMIPRLFDELDDKWLRQRIEKHYASLENAESKYEEQKRELVKIREEYTRNPPDFLFATNTLRDSMFERVMYFMDWAFFSASPETEFLTCDDPVLFSKGIGLRDEDAVIMFPLSRKFFLQAMWNSGWGNTYQKLDESQLAELNTYVVQNAHKQVYACENSTEILKLVNDQIGAF